MKNLLLTLIVMISFGICASAQTPDEIDIETSDVELQVITPAEPVEETEQEIKEREKRLREHNDEVAYAKAYNSLRRGYFVLLADNIQIGNTGYRHHGINTNSNFILVQADDGIIQFAVSPISSGSNGLGGWTGKGSVRNKNIKFNDNGDVYMQYQLIGPYVNAEVYITLFRNSNRAVAQVSGGTSITFYGEILPYRDKKHR